MTVDDFIEDRNKDGLLLAWTSRTPLATPFGDFEIRLSDGFDSESIAAAENLMRWVTENVADIHEHVFDHYQRCREEHPSWMRSCNVPLRLRYDRISKYVRCMSINIRKIRGKATGSIFVVPKWETEHGIDLEVRDGRLVTA
jgi:hypothetical protein